MRPGGPSFYVLDASREPRATNDALEFGRFFENDENRRVAWTKLATGVVVSTVFLGIDHGFGREGPPVLFETMVFGGPLDGEMNRYASWGGPSKGTRRWSRASRRRTSPKREQSP